MSDLYPQGWLGPDAAERAWESETIRANFCPYPRRAVREYYRYAPWDQATLIATGEKWLKHYAQEIGSCVSHGMTNALQYKQCNDIMLGERERFAYIFPPYLYAIGRMSPEGGNGQLGSSDGSLGSWQVAACLKHGVLFYADDDSLQFSGAVETEWGSSKTIWKKWQPTAVDNLIRSAAKLTSAEEVRDAICDGRTCTIASSVGFDMKLKNIGGKSFFTGSASWSHQMAWIAYAPQNDTGKHPEAVFCMNSWGDSAHGEQLDGPQGGGWVELSRVDEIVKSRGAECYAINAWDGWQANELDVIMKNNNRE